MNFSRVKNIKKIVVSSLLIGTLLISQLQSALTIGDLPYNKGVKGVHLTGLSNMATVNKVNTFIFEEMENVYLINADNPVDAISGGVFIGITKGATVLVKDNKIDDLTREKIKRAKNVYIIGGETSVSDSLVKGFENYRGRISGNNRYETAVEVSKRLGVNRDILMVNGSNIIDAISAVSLAINEDMTILFTDKDELPEVTKKELLNSGEHNEIYFVGGENVISTEVKEEVYRLANKDIKKIHEKTISGNNRYETSVEVSKKFSKPVENAVLVNGEKPGDAVASIPLAGFKSAPIMLVDNQENYVLGAYLSENKSIKELIAVSTEDNIKLSYMKSMIANINNVSDNQVKIDDGTGKELKTIPVNTYNKIEKNLEKVENKAKEVKPAQKKEEQKKETVFEKVKKIKKVSDVSNIVKQPVQSIKNENKPALKNPGTKEVVINGKTVKYKKVIEMKATAYDASYESNGQWGGITAIGTKLRPGVVAVDPSIIPLRSKVYVEGTDSWGDYGQAVAEDVGGAIKGNRIDLFYSSKDTVKKFGRRNVKVYVLE